MSRIPGIRRYLRLGRSDASVRRQVDDEIAFHFAMCVDDLVARGMTPEQARIEAERKFGNVALVRNRLAQLDRERIGQERRADWWAALGQDARYAARGLRRSPVFTIGVVLTLALGIGANSAVFTLVDRLLLRAPPHIAHAENLRRVHVDITLANRPSHVRSPMSYPEFRALEAGVAAFEGLAAFNYPSLIPLGRGVDAPRIKRSRVTGRYFAVLGVRPHLGRLLLQEDDSPSMSKPAAVLGYAFWERQFGGSRDVLGKPLVLGGREFVIVGVTPKGFSGSDLDAADVWVPVAPVAVVEDGPAWANRRMGFGFHLVARVKPGWSDERISAQASAAIRPAYTGTFFEAGAPRVMFSSIIPGKRLDQRDPSITIASRLTGATAIVLLIACANVANLLVARSLARRREIAVRLALGVGRGRLITQLLTESMLLALLGGAGALLVAVWGGGLLRALVMPEIAWAYPAVDGRVLVFTAAVALVVGIVSGLVPALQSTNTSLTGALKSGWRDAGRSRSLVRSGLLLAQAAFSVVLLIGAGLFVRSLHNAKTADLGFDLDHTILGSISLVDSKTATVAHYDQVFAEIVDRARRVPGVAQASVAAALPFYTTTYVRISVPGIDSMSSAVRAPLASAVGPEFFTTMRSRLVGGRVFDSSDRDGSPLVTVLNASMARRLWPNESAIGKCIHILNASAPCRTVVGIVGDMNVNEFREEPASQYYLPLAQTVGNPEFDNRYLIVRAADGVPVTDVAMRVRAAIRGTRSDLEALNVRPMLELADPEIRPFRLGAAMFGVMGLLALVLAGVGLYAVISFGVTQRTREFGIRSALGAGTSDVLHLVLGEGLRVALAGTLLGVGLALALGRVVESLLFNASARDPLVFAVVTVTLLVVAAIASTAPAWRAARIDPLVALRED